MAKLNQGLTLNQMQLLAYSIFRTQVDGTTVFRKKEFQSKFEIQHYHTRDAFEDSDRVSALRYSISDLDKNKFSFMPIFSELSYDNGVFSLEWNDKFLPHILELKEKYVITDFTITSKFNSSFSWVLYDYLKSNYGQWSIEISKEGLMNLFSVEDKKTYQNNTNRFKKSVIDVAIEELNEYTELEVWYEDVKVGNKIARFIIYWSTGKQIAAASEKQKRLLREIHQALDENAMDFFSNEHNQSDFAPFQKTVRAYRELYSTIKEESLSATKASEYIKEALYYYKTLHDLLESNGKKRDTSIYYNWLEEDGEV